MIISLHNVLFFDISTELSLMPWYIFLMFQPCLNYTVDVLSVWESFVNLWITCYISIWSKTQIMSSKKQFACINTIICVGWWLYKLSSPSYSSTRSLFCSCCRNGERHMISDINLFTQSILILIFVGFDYVLLPVANKLSLAFVTFSLCSNYPLFHCVQITRCFSVQWGSDPFHKFKLQDL